ncbi:serine/threonine-protein kinase SBK1-like [Rhinatrema bivittatum]|uniref:serine/threonine-protein kinase SBK1-like n=1 Tax=Rhinatrema bivittatum TaxID=194408 RepID=UPI00112A0556|nr:serine/threonine-protein kinase SBK1-like [Rhinatrema bivittatum]XP_029441164.1 serine/threonine-protein kinase SBK1-like [Rhinatrema bivittatum]XP_029441165.1 serine/threonine-protein kinase SBK1-like [Rhinatrema bivittatum]
MNLNEMAENEEILQEMMELTSQTMPQMELNEHYRVIRELGSGSYGHVLLAEHRQRGKSMALKLMEKKETRRTAFLLEYCVSLCLASHPHVIGTFGIAFETKKHFVFVQQLAPAGDLFSILEPGLGLPELMVKRCTKQLADALDFMHNKALVHRDIKLDNILLFDKGCRLIKLADFGLTRLESFPISPMSGTLPYTSPELCSLETGDTLDLDPSLDVWAFGVLLFCLSTGYFPWDVALNSDKQYQEFASWQNNQDYLCTPSQWKAFTAETLEMFRKLLALNPDKRSPAIEALKYLETPWRVSNQNNKADLLDNSQYLEKVDNMSFLKVKASVECRVIKDACSRMPNSKSSSECSTSFANLMVETPNSHSKILSNEGNSRCSSSLDGLVTEGKSPCSMVLCDTCSSACPGSLTSMVSEEKWMEDKRPCSKMPSSEYSSRCPSSFSSLVPEERWAESRLSLEELCNEIDDISLLQEDEEDLGFLSEGV